MAPRSRQEPRSRPRRFHRKSTPNQRALHHRPLPHRRLPPHGPPAGFDRNPFYERGVFSVDLRVTKGFVWWKDHGIFLFGIGFYNLTNHTNALRVSQYVGLPTYRGLIETLNARQAQFSFQWEF